MFFGWSEAFVPQRLVFSPSGPPAPSLSSYWRIVLRELGPTIILLWKPLSFLALIHKRNVIAACAAMGVFLKSNE
jgi:hypothetical protein